MLRHLHSVAEHRDRDLIKRPLRVVVADDHPGLRRSLRLLLEQDDGVEVVADAGDFATTLEQTIALHPDVVVLDLHMPDGSVAERIAQLSVGSARTAIVVVTMEDSAVLARQALTAGALGFVLADSADRELADAIREVVAGHVYRSPRVSRP